VQFLTAGNTEFKGDHRVKAVVSLELVPLLARKGADEALRDAGLHTNTGDARRELCPKGISDRPTARARAEGKPGHDTPRSRVRFPVGERLAHDTGILGMCSLGAASLAAEAGGRGRESGAMAKAY
jgi:hypothetical protein